MSFANRSEAGHRLGEALRFLGDERPTVLGMARGGVPVAFEVATLLRAPLDVLAARKLGAPGREELAVGAVAPEATYLAHDVIGLLEVSPSYVDEVIHRERERLRRYEERYRRHRSPLPLRGRPVILVDDGVATGATMLAAIESVRKQGATKVTVAVPICAPDTVPVLRQSADAVVCLQTPSDFTAVGQWYDDFTPTGDDEVTDLLERADRNAPSP